MYISDKTNGSSIVEKIGLEGGYEVGVTAGF
jgi:hypothetical protein